MGLCYAVNCVHTRTRIQTQGMQALFLYTCIYTLKCPPINASAIVPLPPIGSVQVQINFLPVGHTHEDVDQLFSKIGDEIRRCGSESISGML